MLEPGTKAPDIHLNNQDGEPFNLSSLIGQKAIVLYFYPKDGTYGCTKEACAFRDHYEDFKDAGAEVIGVSVDSVESHHNFSAKKHLPFILLSDPESAAHKAYKVGKALFGLFNNRVTYVIDKQGVIQHAFMSQRAINRHVNDALEIVKSLV